MLHKRDARIIAIALLGGVIGIIAGHGFPGLFFGLILGGVLEVFDFWESLFRQD
ncbi:MAG TPA: hypothetical protein VF168_12335 [Trueperaceae bacterium]